MLAGRLRMQFDTVSEYNQLQKHRARAVLWEMLFDFEELIHKRTDLSYHPALKKSLMYIEKRLHTVIKVQELSEKTGISSTHLGRLFREKFNMSPEKYIQKKKQKNIEHYLLYTDLSIKEIADLNGYRDLHHFNKTIHKMFGKSPRDIRNRHRT
jgi:AraC-like DNA-binding protein